MMIKKSKYCCCCCLQRMMFNMWMLLLRVYHSSSRLKAATIDDVSCSNDHLSSNNHLTAMCGVWGQEQERRHYKQLVSCRCVGYTIWQDTPKSCVLYPNHGTMHTPTQVWSNIHYPWPPSPQFFFTFFFYKLKTKYDHPLLKISGDIQTKIFITNNFVFFNQ